LQYKLDKLIATYPKLSMDNQLIFGSVKIEYNMKKSNT